jgi:hypothetical protein
VKSLRIVLLLLPGLLFANQNTKEALELLISNCKMSILYSNSWMSFSIKRMSLGCTSFGSLFYDSALPPAKSRDCSFWWRDCIKLLHKFKEISSCPLKNGSTIMLWKDIWHDQPLQHSMPHLASFARSMEISV